MENKVLERIDRMITQHELLLTRKGLWQGAVPGELVAEIKRLEKGLYALREAVHGFVRARECGFPLENYDSYLESMARSAEQAEQWLLAAIAKLEALSAK